MKTLRQAVAADLPEIWAVRYSVAENILAPGRLSDSDVLDAMLVTGRGWVIEVGGRVEAFAIGKACTGQVWALFVRPASQGRGYGKALHAAMIDWFKTQSTATLWLSTGANTRARHFYEQNGWICVGPYGSDEVRYERPNALGQAPTSNPGHF